MNRRRSASPPPAVHLWRDALAGATAAADGSHPYETGGILLGWRADPAVVVAAAIEVVDVGASPHRYRRHHAAAQAELAAALSVEPRDSPLGYVGEWHVHPTDHGPSWQDRREMAAISRRSGAPVALIVIAGRPSAWTLYALTGWRGRTTTATIACEEPR